MTASAFLTVIFDFDVEALGEPLRPQRNFLFIVPSVSSGSTTSVRRRQFAKQILDGFWGQESPAPDFAGLQVPLFDGCIKGRSPNA
jgi:hypothetical protein